MKAIIWPTWKHYNLKRFFAASDSASHTLTFKQIEEIDGRPLPNAAYNAIAEAWLTDGYYMEKHDIKK